MSWKRQYLAFHFIWNLVLCATSEGLGSASEGVGESTEYSFLGNMAGPPGKSQGQLSEQRQYNALMAEKLEDLGLSSNTLGKHKAFSRSKAVSRQRQDSIGNRNQLKTTETKLLDSNESFSMETRIDRGIEEDKRGWEGLHFHGKRNLNKRGWEGLNFHGKRGWEGLRFNGRRGLDGIPTTDKRGWEGLNFRGKRGWEGLNFNGRRGSEDFPIKGKRGWEGLNFNGKRGWEGLNFNGKRGWEGLNFNGRRGQEGFPSNDKRGWEGLNFHGKRDDESRVGFVEKSADDDNMANSPISDKAVSEGENVYDFKSTSNVAMKKSDNVKRGWEGLTMSNTCKCCEKGEFWRCCDSCRHKSMSYVQPKYAQKRDLLENIICACCLRSNIQSCCDVCHGIKGVKTG